MLNELYKILEKPNSSKYGGVGQKIILINILVNIFVTSIPYLFALKATTLFIFNIIEYITLTFFVIELISRYVVIGRDQYYQGFMGRLRFTFTPYIIIDIFALLPYLLTSINADTLLIKLLRFIRVLKLIRLKKVLSKFFDIGSFATSNILVQMSVLFVAGTILIFIFKFAYSSPDTSIMIFLDPPALVEAKTTVELLFGILELILGLFVAGTFISIITEALVNITSSVKHGYHPYSGNNHIVIINNNPKLNFILEEMNHNFYEKDMLQDIIIFLPSEDNIEGFYQNLLNYSNLSITLITGNYMNWSSYVKLNINHVKSLLFLSDKNIDIKYQDIKIIRFLLSNHNFHNETLEFIIETENHLLNKQIYKHIFNSSKNDYTLVSHMQILENFLNRSIINSDFYKVFSKVLSFKDSKISIEKYNVFFDESKTFQDLYMEINQGIIIGIIKNNKLILNPNSNTILTVDDELIILFKNINTYDTDRDINYNNNFKKLQTPQLKEDKKICIIGNHTEIKQENITQFLTPKSINKIKSYHYEDINYNDNEFWDNIISENYDTIIFNIEDDEELILMFYLYGKYCNNYKFLQSIVNIMHSPDNAMLLSGKKELSSIILSKKIAGQYITQLLFNKYTADIFDELTHTKGSEFYIFEKSKNKEFFEMSYIDTKATLLANGMLYIGTIIENKFKANDKNLKDAIKIVVLAKGIGKSHEI